MNEVVESYGGSITPQEIIGFFEKSVEDGLVTLEEVEETSCWLAGEFRQFEHEAGLEGPDADEE